MREVRELELPFHALHRVRERGVRLAHLLHRERLLPTPEGPVFLHELGRAALLRARFIPGHAQRLAAFLRRPHVAPDDRDAARDLHHVDHSRDGFRLGGIERAHPCPEARRPHDHRGHHLRQHHVDRELLLARRLRPRIEPRQLLVADDLEVGGILEGDVRRDGQLCRGAGELAEGRLAARAGVRYHAFAHRDVRRGHAPARGGRSDQHRARGGARLAQLLPGVGHGRGPAGELRVGPQRHEGQVLVRGNLGRCALDTHLRPGGIELLGDDSRKPGPHALPRLEVLGDHGDGVIGRDAQERHRERAGDAAGTGLRAAAGQQYAEREPGTGERSQLQELPPRQLRG